VHLYYNALQAKFNRRFSNGFMLTTAYTYGKSLDFAVRSVQTTPGGPEIGRYLEKGRSDNDNTHIFTQSYIYELPFAKGKMLGNSRIARAILGGWQLNGLLLLQSGSPLNLTYPNANLNTAGHDNRPNLAGEGAPTIYGNVGPGQLWFDTSRFTAPAALTFGNAGRNILSGPGVVNIDGSVFRKFRIKEGISLEFRLEAFNVSNTPHFANPNTTFGNAGFGQVTSSNDFTDSTTDTDNRKLQVGMRLFF